MTSRTPDLRQANFERRASVQREVLVSFDRARRVVRLLGEDLRAIRSAYAPRGLDEAAIHELVGDLRMLLSDEGLVDCIAYAFYTPSDIDYMGLRGRLVAALWVYRLVPHAEAAHVVHPRDIAPPREAYRLPFNVFVRFTGSFLLQPKDQQAYRLRGLSNRWRENELTLIAVQAPEAQVVFRAGDLSVLRSAYLT